MFDVTLTGVDALLKTFDALAARVHSLQYTIPREFEDWRTQDMHSRYPTPQIIRRGRRLRVTKRIWNRGRGKAAKHPRPKHRSAARIFAPAGAAARALRAAEGADDQSR